ncbi:BZ3500_MvSof-1268-A1-R1_C157g00807 [Microbotryum saponariae]|uniref:BZ3500_MvSof-1268-A1-R1_C157g00807 protein n=1 Tax=Microbotryum saponariae TaxID=289078 RepID=A0A2X0K7K7_9BASI|nr:BZ3500_MvSof-1268-A1-R1_C157g00807 [Microbotryum saponariae]
MQEGESFKWIKAKTRAARDGHFRRVEGFLCQRSHHLDGLHVLSFDIPPQWFIKAAETALTDFVWGGAGRIPSLAISCSRLGRTVAWFDFDWRLVHSVALRFWDAVVGSDEAIWAPLARESWSTARVEKLYRDSTRWGAVVAAARVTVPTIKCQHAYDDADAVAKFAQIADLYWRDEGKGWALVWSSTRVLAALKEPALQHEARVVARGVSCSRRKRCCPRPCCDLLGYLSREVFDQLYYVSDVVIAKSDE